MGKLSVQSQSSEKGNVPNLGKDIDAQEQNTFRILSRNDQKRTSQCLIRDKPLRHRTKKDYWMLQIRDAYQVQEQVHPVMADFTGETPKRGRPGNNACQTLKENNRQPRLLYPVKLSSRIRGKKKDLQVQIKEKGNSWPFQHSSTTEDIKRNSTHTRWLEINSRRGTERDKSFEKNS